MRGGLIGQIGVALQGNFDNEVALGRVRTENALAAAAFEFGDELQSKWRADLLASGLANVGPLSKTIRVGKYRNRGMNPAVLVYSNFPIIQRAFEAGAVIRSDQGAFLPIPNPAVWPEGRVSRRGFQRSVSTIAIAERRFGRLKFVYRPGRASLLIAEVRESATTAGQLLAARDSGGRSAPGLQSVVVFFLVRQARLPRKLRGAEIRRRAERDAPIRMQQLFVKHFEADPGTGLLTHRGSEP